MNLATVTISPNEAYQDLATLGKGSFTEGNTYVMQVIQGKGLRISESSTLPTKGGFLVRFQEKFQYTAGTGNLYVKNTTESDVVINIAGDGEPWGIGSFDKDNQTLTIKNSYLVNMVNASTVSSEIKEGFLSEIGDDDAVFDMTTDENPSMGIEDAGFWTFLADNNVLLSVNKTNPTVMNFLVTEGSFNITDWSSMAEMASIETGETVTVEQVQELYGQYVTDSNIMTISGTLGNFEVDL